MPPTSILNLPPEILSQILGLILSQILHQQRFYIGPGTGILALLLTCQQLYRLTLPLLYRKLEFTYPCWGRTSRLHRSLQSDSSLLPLVRSLVLVLQRYRTNDYFTTEDYAAAAGVLSLFRGAQVHTLRIRREVIWSPEDQERLQSKLEPGQNIGFGQWELLQHALRQLPALRRVEMMGDRGLRGAACVSRADPTILSAIRREAHKGCASVQDDAVLQQPTTDGLIDFTLIFDERFKDRIPQTPTAVKVFYPWLQAHPHALRRIAFGVTTFRSLGLEFRAAAFPNLHTVVCPPLHVLSETYPRVFWPPAAVIDQFLGSTVRTFVWDLINFGKHYTPGGMWGFDEPQARWLLALAEGAVADKNTALRTIRIEFVSCFEWLSDADPNDYPWDRMDRLKQKLGVLGIALEYDAPTIPREQFPRYCNMARHWKETGEWPST